MTVFEVTMLMGAFVMGGTLSQWPIGRLSDDHDRRVVILPVAAATVLTGLTIAFAGNLHFVPMMALAILRAVVKSGLRRAILIRCK